MFDQKIVRSPFSLIFLITSKIAGTSSKDIPAVGSSNNSTSVFNASSMAISNFRFSPCARFLANVSFFQSNKTIFSHSSVSLRVFYISKNESAFDNEYPLAIGQPVSHFHTVKLGNTFVI